MEEEKKQLEVKQREKEDQFNLELADKENRIQKLEKKLKELNGKPEFSTETLIKDLQGEIKYLKEMRRKLEKENQDLSKEKNESETKSKKEIERLENEIISKQQ